MIFQQKVLLSGLAKLLDKGKGQSKVKGVIESLSEASEDIRVLGFLLEYYGKHDFCQGLEVSTQKERADQVPKEVLALKLYDVQVALSCGGAISEKLAEETHLAALQAALGRCHCEAVDEDLVDDPSLVVHVLLV